MFLNSCVVNSKDLGKVNLGEHLFPGQRYAITEIFDALEDDIHKIYILKSRQLGISTLIRVLIVFLQGVIPGLKGAVIFDTDSNKNKAHIELTSVIDNLPASLKFPKAVKDNREGIILANESSLLFMSAGVRESKSSGTLGRSTDLTVAHMSELCSWQNEQGVVALENAFSEVHPDRLYIYESTARGFNAWHSMWEEAREDPQHCKCVFLGWYQKDSQKIEQSHPDFPLYGTFPPSEKEAKKITQVKELYDFAITVEHLAWIRRKMDPSAQSQGDSDPDFDGDPTQIQEQPWTEEEAFQQTGSAFFAAENLTDLTNKFASDDFTTYMFHCGAEFADMRIFKADNVKSVELKVWEEPDHDGVYVLGIDPAYGENEHNCRSSIQVLRCYADGIDQVAEYAWPLVTTRQLSWAIASLLGWYGAGRGQVRYILELNGPGGAVLNSLKDLKFQVENGYQFEKLDAKGLRDIFRNVSQYIYSRVDSVGAGHNYHFKCLAEDTPLPTPTGWVTMGEVKLFDELFDENGQVCRVVGASDLKRGMPCYRVVFDDGSAIVADEEHLWSLARSKVVSKKHKGKTKYQGTVEQPPVLCRTSELNPKRDRIWATLPLQLPQRSLPIHPYVLGVWLGDGSSDGGRYFSSEKDIPEMERNLAACGVTLGKRCRGRTVTAQNVVGLYASLRVANLLHNKHIPADYLRASFEQRLALLQGLMDTDGYVNPKNGRQCSFVTTNPRLVIEFSELLRSLGFKAKSLSRTPTLRYKGKDVVCSKYYQFWFTGYSEMPVFRMRRKLAALSGGSKQYRSRASKQHKIVSVERVESAPVRCVLVDSPSHLFLAGEGMVPTHNTTAQTKILIMERLRDFASNGNLRVRSMELIKEMKSISRDGDSISAPASMKDDRVVAIALAAYYWETKIRRDLIVRKMTRDSEAARKRLSIVDQVQLFNQNNLAQFFSAKRQARVSVARTAQRQTWRYGR